MATGSSRASAVDRAADADSPPPRKKKLVTSVKLTYPKDPAARAARLAGRNVPIPDDGWAKTEPGEEVPEFLHDTPAIKKLIAQKLVVEA